MTPMTMIDVALECIRRGWYVFPCWPETKKPMTAHGWKDASVSEEQVRAWWTKMPNANVAIACNQSNLCVVDVDYGLAASEDAEMWAADAGIPLTYAVRTGRRPGFGIQLYYSGAIPDVGLWEYRGCSGQVKSLGGYVMAAGCVHPDSKARYEVLWDPEIQPTPTAVQALQTRTKQVSTEPGKKIPEGAGRHDALMRVACSLRARGLDGDTIYASMVPVNDSMCEVPISDDDLKAMCYGIEKRYPAGEPDPVAVLGRNMPEPPKDWREHYHTFDEMNNAPPVSFLIDGFLPEESIAGLAAPAGQRKSLIALNVAWAFCSGNPLFDKFAVLKRPERVLYLCPEMGIRAFTDRLRKIGLMEYVGKTLFCRTMSAAGVLEIEDLQPEEVKGAVVILDTAIRYLKGDENSSEHMRKFAASVFHISEMGAASVLVLHHSAKGTKESPELTLENVMRGSGELGAFLTLCWGTRLQNPGEPYKSASFMTNVKQRDFESKPFEVTSTEDCRLHYVETDTPVILQTRSTANKDGNDAAAIAILKQHPKLGCREASAILKEHGIKRGKDWVNRKRGELLQEPGGVVL